MESTVEMHSLYGSQWQKKERIKQTVEDCLKEKNSLQEVFLKVEAECNCKLSNIDLSYVEDIYIDLLIQFWVEEEVDNVATTVQEGMINDLNNTTDLQFILDRIENLSSTRNFEDCFNNLDGSKLIVLLCSLCKTSKRLQREEENIVNTLKQKYLKELKVLTKSIKNEINFLADFVELMKSSINLKELEKTLNLTLLRTNYDDFSLENFLVNLDSLSGLNGTKLKQSGRKLQNQKSLFIKQNLKDLASTYLKPVTITNVRVDGRRVLEVEGKHIVTSTVLKDIESIPNFFEIEEVRMVKAGVVHVDADFQNSKWHGKNIVLMADSVIVSRSKNVVWDVSGKDAQDTESIREPAGTATNGWGLPGAHGNPAESGGNICILTDSAINLDNLKVISNGGRGGNGQDGGKGVDGSPGNDIDSYSFESDFPAVAKFMNSEKLEFLNTTINSVTSCLHSVEELYIGSTKLQLPISKSDFERACNIQTVDELKNIYFKVETRNKNKITFSFFFESFSVCQALLLYEGSEGEEGKPGGAGGFGGKGGFPGNIYIQVANDSIETNAANSIQDGVNGNPGPQGNPGRSGVDRGYADRTLYWRKKWPLNYAPHYNLKLTVEFDETEDPFSVWCPFYDKYAKITTIQEKHKIQQSFPWTSIQSTSEQRAFSVQANRKKTICPRTVQNKYQESLSVLNIYKIKTALDHCLKKVEELLNAPSVQSEQLTMGLKTTKSIEFRLDDMSYEEGVTVPEATSVSESFGEEPNTMSVAHIIDAINDESNSVDCSLLTRSWLIKSQVDVASLTQLWNEIFELFQKQNQSCNGLSTLFLNKYKLAVLQEVEQSLFCLILPSSNNTKHSRSNAKLLSVDSRSLVTGNAVEKYFVEDSYCNRCEAIELCKAVSIERFLTITNCTAPVMFMCLNASVNDHVLKNFDSRVSTLLSDLFKQYEEFIQTKEQRLDEKLIPVIKDLQKRKNAILLQVLINSILEHDNQYKITFEKTIQKDKFLSKLIKRYAKNVNQEFDWKSFLKKSPTLKMEIETEIYNNIERNGPNLAYFREFLAFHYKTNILIFSRNENGALVMIDNHNPRSDQSVHFLVEKDLTDPRKNRFIKLHYNVDLAKVIEEHEIRGSFLTKVMSSVEILDKKTDLDGFVRSLRDYKGVTSSDAVKVKISHIMSQKDNITVVANSYNAKEDIDMVTSRLEKLQSEFLSLENILHFMALRFQTEEKRLSAKELCFVINLILKFALKDPQAMPLVSWTFAAFVQTKWLVELTILQLEYTLQLTLHFELKKKWRVYLSGLKEKESLMFLTEKLNNQDCQMSVESVDEILHLFSIIPSAHVGLMHIPPVEWKYYLKDKFWAQKLLGISNWTNDHLKILTYYILTLENTQGKKACEDVMSFLKEKASVIDSESDRLIVLETIKSLTTSEININKEILISLSERDIDSWQEVIDAEHYLSKERSPDNLFQLIRSSGNSSENITKNLQEIENKFESCIKIVKLIKYDQKTKETSHSLIDTLLNAKTSTEAEKALLSLNCDIYIDENTLKKIIQKLVELKARYALVPFIIKVIEVKQGITLRYTQILTVMTMLESKENILAQVSTGEGKSLIVVVLAALSAMLKKKVNIVTSSRVLAMRDAKLYEDIYSFCDVSVGHNCSEDIEERKETYSNCQVIYGELGNFQRDFLLDRVYGKNILGNCTFEVVLIDEVDSMVLDKCNNVLYLAHDIPWLDKLEPVFIFIWNWINSCVEGELDSTFSILELKKKLLLELFGLIELDNVRYLDTRVGENQVQNTWDDLVRNKIIDNDGVLIMHNMEDITDALNCVNGDLKDHLICFFDKIVNREQTIYIPKFLQGFVKNHLEEWILSAVTAFSMDIDKDYVIDVDRTGTASERSPNIVILDRDTGTDQVNSQWERGLHQFLQLKHGTKLSTISLKAVFISNKSYLKLYKKLYGLTGTLGSTKERDLLKTSYNTDFVTIPTAKKKVFSEEFPLLCSNTEKWASVICRKAVDMAKSRSVLIICESVNDVIYLKGTLSGVKKVSTYTRDYENLDVSNSLDPGHIIVATNLAGRGTDIKLSQKLVEAGGLHVILAFMPSNCRVEEQAYGRVARNGQPGSGQMIFKSKLSYKHNISKVIDLKTQRDMNEVKRLTEIKRFHDINIKSEELWCEKFQKVYNELNSGIKQDEDIKNIFLQYCMNQWAFWLEEHSKHVSSGPNSILDLQHSFEKFELMCEKLCDEDFSVSSKQVTEPSVLIKLGLAFMKKKEYLRAVLLFNRVIEEEAHFSESALYYRVCAECSIRSLNMSEIMGDLEKVANMFQKRINLSLHSAAIIDNLKECCQGFLQIDAFSEQHTNLGQLYNIFLQSVNRIRGCEITPQVFFVPTVIDAETANKLFHDLIENNLIRKPKIKAYIERSELNFVSEYGLNPQNFYSFLTPFSGKDLNEHEFLKKLKETVKIPCKEFFWEELSENKLLLDEESLVVVNTSKLNTQDPSTCIQLSELEVYSELSDNRIWLKELRDNHTFRSEEGTEVVYKMKPFSTLVGLEKYKFLLNEGIIYETKSARLSSDQTSAVFHQFDSIAEKDFDQIGVSPNIASSILNELEEKNILKKTPLGYSLSVALDKIPGIVLSRHKQYEEEVRALLRVCFSFRIALDMLRKDVRSFPNLILYNDPYLQIVDELRERNIIKHYTVDSECEITEEVIKAMYPKTIEKSKYVKLLGKVYGEGRSFYIVQNLVESGWLEKDESSNQKNKLYKFNTTNNRNNLHIDYSSETSTIHLILHNYVKTVETVHKHSETIANRILSCKGSGSTVQTLSFSLKPLIEIISEQNIITTECNMLSLNGCDQVFYLKEKQWTLNLSNTNLVVLALSLCQIVGGLYFQIKHGSPVGDEILLSGINNLINGTTCVFSNQKTNFLVLLSQTIKSLAPKILDFAVSKFGRKLGIGVCNGLDSNAVTNTTTKSPIAAMETTIKTIAVHASKATALGIATATMDSVIEPQLEKLGKLIADNIYSEIDKSVDCHPVVDTVKNVRLRFNKEDSTNLINTLFLKSVKNHKNKIEHSFKEIADSMSAPILKAMSDYFKQNMKNTEDKLQYCVSLGLMLNNLAGVFQKNRNRYFQHFDIVREILDELEVDLQRALRIETQTNSHIKEIYNTTVHQDNFNKRVKDQLKSLFAVELNATIVSPVLNSCASVLLKHSFKVLSDKFHYSSCNEEVNGLKTFYNDYLLKAQKHDVTKHTTQELSQANYDECLLELFNRTNRSQIFLELLRRNAIVDENYLDVCCSLIPAVLRKEGIDLPGLQIIVDRNGKKQSFLTNESKVVSTPTVYINPERDFIANLKKNTVAIGEVLKAVVTDLIPIHSAVSYSVDVLQTLIIKAVENDQTPEYLFKSSELNSLTYKSNKINTTVIRSTLYENSIFDKHLAFAPTADIDLKEERKFSSLTDFENHIKQGFRISLDKINCIVENHLKHSPKFELSHFDVTDYKITPNTNHLASTIFHCYPTSYSLVAPLPVTDGTLVNFEISMKLKSKSEKRRGPCGAHIVYEVIPKDSFKHLDKCRKGHVLLSSESYQEKSYEVKDCVTAGELVLPTFGSITCKVLVLGDSLLKNIYEHTSELNCVSKSFRSIKSLRANLTNLSKQFKGIEQVVLYIGTDLVTNKISQQEIVNTIAETAIDVQDKLNSDKIVLCGLLLREFPASSNNRKIEEINKKLKSLSDKMNFDYLETNGFFHNYFTTVNKKLNFPSVRYCKGDGVYLNKKGYKHLGKCVSSVGLAKANIAVERAHIDETI